MAWNHLSAWHASRYVEKNLKRGKIEEAELVPESISITHYVRGSDKVLLLEPISLSQSPASTVGRIFTRFSTYLYNWNPSGREPEAITYVLPGSGHDDDAALIKEHLGHLSTVVFTANPEERSAFVARIEDVGRSAELVTT